jgi:hypothetical protein
MLADGRVLVFGGWSQLSSYNTSSSEPFYNSVPLRSAEIYDPASNSFSATGSTVVPHAGVGASLLGNGDAFLASGIVGFTPQFTPVTEEYHVGVAGADGGADAAGTFTSAGPLPGNAAGYALVQTLGSRQVFVLLLGGVAETAGVTSGGPAYLFDPTTGAFTSVGNDLFGANGGLRLPSGNVFLAGGGGAASPTAQTELYLSSSSTFALTGDMTSVRREAIMAILPSGGVLVMGGCAQNGCAASIQSTAEVCGP